MNLYKIFLAGGAIVYILLMSTSTSPFYFNFSVDSAFFLVFGKSWSEGMIPYIDMWDQKGPLIFLANMIGFSLTGNRYGVMLVQITCMWATFLLLWNFLRRHYCIKYSIIMFVVLLGYMGYPFELGNTVEEYKTPLMLWSFCLMCDWTYRYREKPVHRPLDAFVYGLTIGACFLSRLIDGFPLFLGVMVIAIYLGYKKAWRNLWHNVIGITLGFMILVIPFVIYFYSHDALWWFWYGTIGYNLEYFQSSSHSWNRNLYDLLRYFMQVVLPLCLMMYGMILNLRGKWRNVEGYLWIVVGMSTTWWILKSFGYNHYAYVTFPYLLILIVKITPFNLIEHKGLNKVGRIVYIGLLVGCALFLPFKAIKFLSHRASREYQTLKYLTEYEQPLKYIPKTEWDETILHNVHALVYLHMNIRPYCKFYGYQDWNVSNSPSFPRLLLEEYSRRPAKWIVYYGVKDCPRQSPIYKLLSSRYRKMETRGTIPFSVYRYVGENRSGD